MLLSRVPSYQEILDSSWNRPLEKLGSPSLTADSAIHSTQTHNTAVGWIQDSEEADYTTVSADLSGLRALTVHFFCRTSIQIPLESRVTSALVRLRHTSNFSSELEHTCYATACTWGTRELMGLKGHIVIEGRQITGHQLASCCRIQGGHQGLQVVCYVIRLQDTVADIGNSNFRKLHPPIIVTPACYNPEIHHVTGHHTASCSQLYQSYR